MQALSNRRWTAPLSAIALSLLAGCSTYTATVKATVGDHLNPRVAAPESSAPLDVYVFFLGPDVPFQPRAKGIDAFLTDAVRRDQAAPDFLPVGTKVARMEIAPDRDETVIHVAEVPSTAVRAGLIADFQWHDDADDAEVWWLELPVRGSTVAFHVAGRRLAAEAPAPPPPPQPETSTSTSTPSNGKEGQRATRRP